MTRIAVTGGAGFIGSNLVAALVSKGHDVSVIDDLSTGFLSNLDQNACTFHEVSLTNKVGLAHAMFNAEVIFHLGARGSVPRSMKSPVETHDVNTTGTVNVLEVARESGAHVFFSSSSSVYGRNTLLPKDESMLLAPMTPYAASKMAAEGYMQAYASSYQIPVTLLRFFNVFGPRQRPDHEYAAVIPKWIWNAMQNMPIDVYGDGSQTRDFTYVQTIVDICVDGMERKVTHEGAINIAFGNRISLLQTIELMKNHFPDLQVNFQDVRAGDVKESQNHPALVKELFPAVNPVPFEKSLSDTAEWLRAYSRSSLNRSLFSE